jgi:hypothetical protein
VLDQVLERADVTDLYRHAAGQSSGRECLVHDHATRRLAHPRVHGLEQTHSQGAPDHTEHIGH